MFSGMHKKLLHTVLAAVVAAAAAFLCSAIDTLTDEGLPYEDDDYPPYGS